MPHGPDPKHPLHPVFYPDSIAIIGASANPDKLGYAAVRNILDGGFRGKVYPVNPNATSILGLDCIADAAQLPRGIDLAIVILPASKTLAVLKTLAGRGVKSAMIPAGGFAETGADGRALQDEIRALCAATGMRVLGPNVPGFINADASLVATFAGGPPGHGGLAVVSQAGSIAYLLVRNFLADRVQFGRFICFGNQVDISDADIIDFLAADANVKAVSLYVESVKDGRRFLDVARRTTASKPIVALKGGRSAAGHGAIFSHTASLSSPERVYRAAFDKAGIVEADSLRGLGFIAFALAHQAPPAGNRVAIVTSLAGVGVIAADRCERLGLNVSACAPAMRERLQKIVPAMGSTRNPIDLTGDVSPAMLKAAIEALAEDDDFDCILPLVMGVPRSEPFGNAAYARAVRDAAATVLRRGKTIAAAWVMDEADGTEIRAVRDQLHAIGVPVTLVPEEAAEIARGLVTYGRYRRRQGEAVQRPASAAWQSALREEADRRTRILTEHACKRLLESAGFPIVPSRLAKSTKEAVAQARSLGFPVALKIQSPDATHKSDIGGILLDVADEAAVRAGVERLTARFKKAVPTGHLDGISVQPMFRDKGVEIVCGVSTDPQFGKYLLLGLGGVMTEVLDDVSLRLLPIGPDDVADMLGELRGAALLKGYRDRPAVDMAALTRAIVRFAALAGAEEIVEFEINPLIATATGATALDARMRLRDN